MCSYQIDMRIGKRKASVSEPHHESERAMKRSKLTTTNAGLSTRNITKKPIAEAEVEYARGTNRKHEEAGQAGKAGPASKRARQDDGAASLPFLRSGKERAEPATKNSESSMKRKRNEIMPAGEAGRETKRMKQSGGGAELPYLRSQRQPSKSGVASPESGVKRKRAVIAQHGETGRTSNGSWKDNSGAELSRRRSEQQTVQPFFKQNELSTKRKRAALVQNDGAGRAIKRQRQSSDEAEPPFLRSGKQRPDPTAKTTERGMERTVSTTAHGHDNEAIESNTTVDELQISIPKPTLRHMARYVAQFQKLLSSAEVCDQMQEQNGSLDRSSLRLSATASRAPQHSSILRLPNELLDMILADLEPADMVCLALTCYQLFMTLDYQQQDLRLGYYFAIIAEIICSEPSYPLVEQVYQVADRLDREAVARLVETEHIGSDDGETKLTCSVCREHHSFHLFSRLQRKKQGSERICLAAEAKVYLCEHWSADFKEVQMETRRLQINPEDPKNHKKCKETPHATNIDNPYDTTIKFKELSGKIVAEQQFNVISHLTPRRSCTYCLHIEVKTN